MTLRFSAYLCVFCVENLSNAEGAEIRREPQRQSCALKLPKEIQREKQSYSECHGAETPDILKISSTCMV